MIKLTNEMGDPTSVRLIIVIVSVNMKVKCRVTNAA